MSGNDMRSAVARRDEGLRTVTRFTWRAGVISVICSGLIGLAFGMHAEAERARGDQVGILVPNQPPGATHGRGQVTSGAT
jgi:hypothetical protein